MNNEIYKKLMQEARQLGGIALRHQTLKLHQNGAKFMISKSYVDDEILEVNMPYTMILIPESSADLISILTYFHPKNGPTIFAAVPSDVLSKTDIGAIANAMDLSDPELKTTSIQVGKEFLLNKTFEIQSSLSRGGKEIVMISALFSMIPTQNTLNEVDQHLEEFITEFQNIENPFTIFYSDKDKPENVELLKENPQKYARILDLLNQIIGKSKKSDLSNENE